LCIEISKSKEAQKAEAGDAEQLSTIMLSGLNKGEFNNPMIGCE
jgi:hypothetical protein